MWETRGELEGGATGPINGSLFHAVSTVVWVLFPFGVSSVKGEHGRILSESNTWKTDGRDRLEGCWVVGEWGGAEASTNFSEEVARRS